MTNGKRHNAQLTLFLRALQIIGVAGLVYCVYLVAIESPWMPQWRLLLYATWFAIAAAAAEAILDWFKAGVFILVIATAAVGLVEIVFGLASWGGFVLALVLLFVLVEFVLPEWWQYE